MCVSTLYPPAGSGSCIPLHQHHVVNLCNRKWKQQDRKFNLTVECIGHKWIDCVSLSVSLSVCVCVRD